jgi:hypothetical protein
MSKHGGHNVNHLATDMSLLQKLYHKIPAFDELFDEQTFYVFALLFTLSSILFVIIISRFVKLKEVNY